MAPKVPPRQKLDWSGMQAKRRVADMNPSFSDELGVGRVIQVDYEEHWVSLRIVMGSGFIVERAPIPISYPGAGARHFLGAMPEIGDYCILGWMPQDSAGKSTPMPVIIGWVIPGVWPGREWLATQGFTADEFDFGTQFQRETVQGVFQRTRHKLRHMQPGNIVGSSSQGSDLVLNESVILSNRRSNELRLRDQDQALVVRTLQQFHAMSGARIYGGMVQRDALTLPDMMFSDGLDWDSDYQTVAGRPVAEEDLTPSLEPDGYLNPADVFYRRPVETANGVLPGTPLFRLASNLDPYMFLRQGGFIDETGYALPSGLPNESYGGKPIYRVAAQSETNAASEADTPTLTEWRLEVAHTSDGRLPVTEQTDLFDAERLPPSDPNLNNPQGLNEQMPFIEFVMGSVVGNDPYTPYGLRRYGLPLVVTVFDGETPAPSIDPVRLVPYNSTGEVPTPLRNHAATLFRLSPPGGDLPDTFWSVNKTGQLKASIGGPKNENSIEAALTGGLKLSCGGEFSFMPQGSIRLIGTKGDPVSNIGAALESPKGAVVIKGGGRILGPKAVTERISGAERGEQQSPSVIVEAEHGVEITANRRVTVKGSEVISRGPSVRIEALTEASVTASDKVVINSKEVDITSGGKRVDSYSGPKDNLPTGGPLHEETYSPNIPGQVVHRVEYTNGSREEEFTLGDHTTTMQVGNITFETKSGEFKAVAGQNTVSLDMARLKAEVTTSGGIVMKASSGPLSLKGSTSARLEATGGPVTVQGSVVRLKAPVDINQGGIVCSGSLEPLSGQPFSTYGVGASNHLVSSS